MAATTFDPAQVVHGALSGGNLTFTHDGTSTDGGDESTNNKVVASGGKFYFEVQFPTIGGGDWGFGVCKPNTTPSAFGNAVTDSVVLFSSNNVWINGSNHGVSGGTGPTNGNTFGILLDLDNNRIRFDNITAGTTGTFFTLPTEVSFVARVNDNSAGTVFNINFGNTPFTGTLPAGFQAFDKQTGLAVTEAPDTASFVGYPGAFGVLGDLHAVEAADAFAAVGFQPVNGTLTVTEAQDVFSAFGRQPQSMAWASIEAADVFRAIGLGRGEDGVWVSTEAPDVAAIVGFTPNSGSFHVTEQADRARFVGAGVHPIRKRRIFFVT